jgi:hypothetical protein
MKKLFPLLASAFISQSIFAQTKPLPGCRTIRTELTAVNNSFDNIVEKFKSKEDKISLVKTYFSEFSICGAKGKIKDYGRNVEFTFHYDDIDYKGTKDEFTVFFEKISGDLKEVFSTTHYYKESDNEEGKAYYFYENGKDVSSSKKIIKLILSYKDPVDETADNSVSLIFEYYPRR